jgi:hypothetical protein
LKSGVFTAPVNGTYIFNFITSTTHYDSLLLYLQLNDTDIASCKKTSYDSSDWQCNIPCTFKLKLGDRVQVSVEEGSMGKAYFTGFLVSEDIFPS